MADNAEGLGRGWWRVVTCDSFPSWLQG